MSLKIQILNYKRLAAFGTTTAVVVPTISEIVRNLYGITKDQVAAARVFVPEFSKESKRMTFILIIYAVAFVSKSAYQWYMFSLHLSTGN